MSNFPNKEFEPLPEGEYMVIVDKLLPEKDNSKGTGKVLNMAFKVISGDKANRLIFNNFNTEHTNAQAVEISTRQLDAYLKAVGLEDGWDHVKDDRSLIANFIQKPLLVDVKIEEAKPNYPKRSNKITAFKAL